MSVSGRRWHLRGVTLAAVGAAAVGSGFVTGPATVHAEPSTTVTVPATTVPATAIAAGSPAGRDGGGHGQRWIGSWMTGMMPGGATPVSAAGFVDQTVRQRVKLSVGGSSVRLELANTFGTSPLQVADVDVARPGAAGSIRPGTSRQVTFGGSSAVTVPKGARVLSDPIRLRVPDQADLTVSIFFSAATGPTTYHRQSRELTFISSAGNHNDDVAATAFATQAESWFYLSGVQVAGSRRSSSVVALGDSITDGDGSTIGADRRWTDVLAQRLLAKRSTRDVSVLNAGIGANRLLNDSDLGGPNALARLDRDVFAQPRVRTFFLLEGVNDLGFSQFPEFPGVNPRTNVSAAEVIAAYQQIIARAHSQEIQVIGATVLPFEGSFYWDAAAEAKRQQINRWIRTSGAFDGVVDFDRVARDPAAPAKLAAAYDSGDHLHPNDAGYRALANAVKLRCVAHPVWSEDGRSARCTRY